MRFSTRDIPAAQRRDVAEAAYGAHVQGSIDFPQGQPIAAEMRLRSVADIHLASVETSPVRIVTPPDDTGILYLGIAAAGGGVIDALGEGRTVKAGDINVMRRERKCVTIADRPSTILSIAIPRARIVPRLASSDSLLPTLSSSLPAARLLQNHVMTLLGDARALTPDEQSVFSAHIVDLVALTLGATRDAGEHARRNGARAARRQTIKADIRANLDAPELSLNWLSKRHGVSASYIRTLFYDEGTSLTDYLMNARLDHVRGLLTDARLADRNIATLALMAGFGDISWFNLVFRRRFGMTPSDMRAGSQGK